jgi:pyrroline-5-carboxylate reductase
MKDTFRLGIVGGGGWLGGAIAESLLKTGLVSAENLCLSHRSKAPDLFPGAFWTADNQLLADRSDVIIVSVRPADWPAVDLDAQGRLVISVMAGIQLSALSARHNTLRVVRSIPNAAAEVGMSYTPWACTDDASEDDRRIIRAIFDACGVQDQVSTERELDYLTGLSGSGPAFPALLAAAMVEDAVAFGLSRQVACRAVNTLLAGAGQLVERSGDSPADRVEAFVGYRGTTAAAIEAMRTSGFDEAVARGLAAAFEKSVRMGRG